MAANGETRRSHNVSNRVIKLSFCMSIVTLQVQNTSIKHSPHMPVTSVLCVAPSARSSTKHRKKLKCSTEQRNFSDDRRAKKNTRMGFKQKKNVFFPPFYFTILMRYEIVTREAERERRKKHEIFVCFLGTKSNISRTCRVLTGSKANPRKNRSEHSN